jgi:hypothetical protein
VIVRDLNVVSIVITPNEADPILVVDADAVFPLPFPLKLFQAIPRGKLHISQVPCCIQHRKFSLRNPSGRRPSSLARSPDFRRLLVGETLDHPSIITNIVNNVNRYYSEIRGAMLYSFAK